MGSPDTREKMVAVTMGVAFVSAFMPPTTLQNAVTRAVVTPSADLEMFLGGAKSAPKKVAGKKVGFKGPASPTKPKVTAKAKPLSPGSNYPTTKNIQTQSSGFGSFVQKFQLASGKSKYGMPIFLPNGNINPAYLAAERKAIAAQSKKNIAAQ